MKKVLAAIFAISMIAGIAAANDGHGGPGGPGFGPEGGFIVGSDGTVYLSTTTVASGVATTSLKAVRASGAVNFFRTFSAIACAASTQPLPDQ